MAEIPLIAVICIIFWRAALKIAAGEVIACLTSSLSAVIYILCLWVPAHLQESGLLISKLELGQTLPFPTSADISKLALAWAVELSLVLVGEMFANFLWRPNISYFPELKGLVSPVLGHAEGAEVKRITNILLVVGLAAVLAFSTSVENRAESGQGFVTIIRTCFTIGLALLAFNKFFSSRIYYLIGAAGMIVLIIGKVRNPLLVVLSGYLAGAVSRKEVRFRRVLLYILAAGVLALLGAWMSTLRGAIVRHEKISPLDALGETLVNPSKSFYGAGIDTLDGYRLSMQILPFEPAHLESLLTVVTTFIPRAIWPDKPVEISNDISARYLSYGNGGMYLSPVGEMSLIFGGYGYALGGMMMFGLISTWAMRTFQDSFILSIVLWTVITFLLAGGFFVVYLALAQLLPLVAATSVVRVLRIESPGRHLRSSSRPTGYPDGR
jgi:hypothetical protein